MSGEGLRLVRQEHEWGCGVAALAMVTGQTYDEVRTWILDNWVRAVMGYDPSADWLSEHGVTTNVLDWYLAQHGYVWRKVYKAWATSGAWPPEPFAPVHVAQVIQPSGMAHSVVVKPDGVVLDPMSDEPRSLGEWEQINHVQGVWSLADVARRESEAAEKALSPVQMVLAKYAGRSKWVGFEKPRREAWAEIESDLRRLLARADSVAQGREEGGK